MAAEQNFKNHARFDPIFHFVLLPLLIANFIRSIYATIHQWPRHYGMHLDAYSWNVFLCFHRLFGLGLVGVPQ